MTTRRLPVTYSTPRSFLPFVDHETCGREPMTAIDPDLLARFAADDGIAALAGYDIDRAAFRANLLAGPPGLSPDAALAAGVAWMAGGGGVDEFADYLDDLLGTRLKETTAP